MGRNEGSETSGSGSGTGSGWLSAKKTRGKTRSLFDAQPLTNASSASTNVNSTATNASSAATNADGHSVDSLTDLGPVIRRRSSSRLNSPPFDQSGNRKRPSVSATNYSKSTKNDDDLSKERNSAECAEIDGPTPEKRRRRSSAKDDDADQKELEALFAGSCPTTPEMVDKRCELVA